MLTALRISPVEQGRADGLGNFDADVLLRLGCARSEVRCENDVLQISQGKVRRRRLDLEDVQRGRGHMLRDQDCAERGFLDESAAGTVDDPNALFAKGEPALIKHMARFVRQRHMQREKIAERQQFINLLDEFDLKAARLAR